LVGAITVAVVQAAQAAPHRILTGVVVDELTGEPVAGVNLTSRHGTVATGADGTFSIAIGGDDTELFVTAPGYLMQTVAIGPSDTLRVSLVTSTELIEVTGTAPKPPPEVTYREESMTPPLVKRPAAQAYGLTPGDLRVLPGTGNDALRAAQALPGVARLPYSFGGIVLRGASPRDSAVYLDGIEVPIAFHFGGVTSFYPSGMLDGLEVTNSGIDAEYGRASGGVIELTSREPRTDRWRTGGSLGLLDSSIFAEGPYNGGGVLVGLRRSYFDIVATPFAAEDTPMPAYWDAQIRGSWGRREGRGRVTPMLFLALDHMMRTEPGRDMFENETEVSSFFVRAAVPYERTWGKTALRIVPWIGANKLAFRSRVSGVTETFERPAYPGGVRSELARETRWGDIRAGIDMQGGYLTHYQAGLGHKGDILVQMNGQTDIEWVDLGLWGETRFDVGRLSIKPGLRMERYGLNDEGVIDPRLSLILRLNESWRMRETVGRYHQPPTPGDVDPNGGNPNLESSYSDTASLGFEGILGAGWWGSLTGYYSRGVNLGVRHDDEQMDFAKLSGLGPTFSLLLEKQLGLAFYRENLGRGRNMGAELLLRRTTKKWMWLIAYTLAKAERNDGPVVSPQRSDGTPIGWRPFELDQRHNLNVAGSTLLGKWRVGARIHLVSGMPYSPTIGVNGDGEPQLEPYGARLPAFFQLDVRADRIWERCWGMIDLYFDIQNITNRRNVEGREPNDFLTGDDDIRGLPIMPFIGVEFIPK
jgi:hypothetical protein